MPMRFLIEMDNSSVNLGMQLSLDAERSHYLCKVLRMKNGDNLACFDGMGTSFTARLLHADRKQSTLLVIRVDDAPALVATPLHLGLSLLKGQAMDRALHQATELGASKISLLTARRSNVALNDQRLAHKMTHWRRVISAACEQSGQLYVPGLSAPSDLDTLLASASEIPLAFDLGGAPLPAKMETMETQGYLLLIGPEGGWDDVERQVFEQHKLTRYSLGEHTLRAETAPAVALALISHLQKI